jgi:hypothetical protein
MFGKLFAITEVFSWPTEAPMILYPVGVVAS